MAGSMTTSLRMLLGLFGLTWPMLGAGEVAIQRPAQVSHTESVSISSRAEPSGSTIHSATSILKAGTSPRLRSLSSKKCRITNHRRTSPNAWIASALQRNILPPAN